MFNSQVIDVAIGLIFVYTALSLLASTVNELLAHAFRLRWLTLATAIANLFDPKNPKSQQMIDSFFDQPVIKSLTLGEVKVRLGPNNKGVKVSGAGLPYIPSDLFSRAVSDLVHLDPVTQAPRPLPMSNADLRSTIALLEDDKLRGLLLSIAGVDTKTLEQFQAKLATWFDQYMDRVKGWYTLRTKWILIGLGLILAILLNLDTLSMANALIANPELRDSVAGLATQYVGSNPAPASGTTGTGTTTTPANPDDVKAKIAQIASLQATLASLNLPILWIPDDKDPNTADPREVPHNFNDWFFKVIGLLITGVLVSLGAPFWFDLLSRITTVRAAGKPPPVAPAVSTTGAAPEPTVEVPAAPAAVPAVPVVADNRTRVVLSLDRMSDAAVRYVEAYEAAGNKLTPDEELSQANEFVVNEVEQRGWNVTGDQIATAVDAAFKRRRTGGGAGTGG